MFRRLRKYAAIFPILLMLTALFGQAMAQEAGEASGMRPAEYMIYQYPGVAMVVITDAPETEFDSRITGPEGAVLNEASVAGRRIGPVYQYIGGSDIPRQLMVHVNPARRIDRSKINMELMQFSEYDRNARSLGQAYRLLAHGMKKVHDGDTSTWAERAGSLRRAAGAFQSLGNEKMRLWSEYYAGHLVLHQIDDVLMALEFADEIRRAAQTAGYEEIDLAAAILEADALVRAGDKSSGESAAARYQDAHDALQAVARLAGELGFTAEQGRALFNDGLVYEKQGRLEEAVAQYDAALETISRADNPDLLNEVRAVAAAAYEARGSTVGAIGLLDDIAGDLAEDRDAGRELADNLYEKGRLLNLAYRFPEAAYELNAALELQKADETISQWGKTGLELGWAHFSMGDFDRAGELLEESLLRTPRAERALLLRSYGALADLSRHQGRFDEMQRYREQQAALTGAASGWQVFESGRDRLARGGSGAAGLFRQAQRLAESAGDTVTRHRADLELCALGASCGAGAAQTAHQVLRQSGIPFIVLDSGLAMMKVLRRAGQISDAEDLAGDILDDLQFYRRQLPGVADTWYFLFGEDLFREYMALTLASGNRDDGARALLALERIRRLDRESGSRAGNDELRNGLSALQAEYTGASRSRLEAVDRSLQAFRRESGWTSDVPGRDLLQQVLAKLGRNEVLLAYYFSDDGSYVLPATRNSVRRIRLDKGGRLMQDMERFRQALYSDTGPSAANSPEALGRALLGPVQGMLNERIYLLASGPMLGFPLDALRLKGRFLAEQTSLIRLETISALQHSENATAAPALQSVFLAGNPQAGQDLFSYGISTSAELDAVRNEFVGEGLHMVQGVALRRDEFSDERFAQAGLLHLAMPGRIDLEQPRNSRLLLSGTRENPSAEFLSADDLHGYQLSASLAVMTGTEFFGQPSTPFDSRTGLVSDLLQAGAARVVSSLWPAGDRQTAALMVEFYQRLSRGMTVDEALFQARKALIDSQNPANLKDWAGFQLYIR
jgi:CHAT domain-containing protein